MQPFTSDCLQGGKAVGITVESGPFASHRKIKRSDARCQVTQLDFRYALIGISRDLIKTLKLLSPHACREPAPGITHLPGPLQIDAARNTQFRAQITKIVAIAHRRVVHVALEIANRATMIQGD